MEKIRVFCKNTGEYHDVKPGSTVLDFVKESRYDDKGVLAAYVNNELKELSFEIYLASTIEFLTFADADGRRAYIRSLDLLVQKAVYDLFPDALLVLQYTLPNGQYGELRDRNDLSLVRSCTEEDISRIKERMQQMVAMDFKIKKVKLSSNEARTLYLSHGQKAKADLVESLGLFFTSVYFLEGYGDTFYGPLVYSTGVLDKWDIVKYDNGFCLQSPDQYPPYMIAPLKHQDKLSEIFRENGDWCEILGAKDISDINKSIILGRGKNLVNIAEALHARKYARIADCIYQRRDRVKLVLIAGPSSSGKTTTAKRIALELKVLGLNPQVIGMDDYFLDRDKMQPDESGNLDFESVYALDLELLNQHLNALFAGEEITLPKFDFGAGCRREDGTKMRMRSGDILVMEGIHALNPILTSKIEDSLKFRVYASALTSLGIDENNVISTTDNRKLRRIVRDNNFRGTSAEETLLRFDSVVAGENKNIFPFQENADIMFNSSLIYELPMLKYYAEPLLRRISPASPVYAESFRLLKFLSYIIELNLNEQRAIPPTSIMREFIGGSVFHY